MKFKKISKIATFERATNGSAGYDLTACTQSFDGSTLTVFLGVVVEIPDGYVGLLIPRSSTYKKYGLTLSNSVGVIDSDYRGELMATFTTSIATLQSQVQLGAKIMQLLLIKCNTPEPEETDKLSLPKTGSLPKRARKVPIKTKKNNTLAAL